jgi:hypothetical protein
MKRMCAYVVASSLLCSGMLTFGMDNKKVQKQIADTKKTNSPLNQSGEYHFGDITKKFIKEGEVVAEEIFDVVEDVIEEVKEIHDKIHPVAKKIFDEVTDNKEVIATALILAGQKSQDAHNITNAIVEGIELVKDVDGEVSDLVEKLEAANIAKK